MRPQEKMHIRRYFSEDIYKSASWTEEILIIPNGVHVDLWQ
jgi:hypothetical protein